MSDYSAPQNEFRFLLRELCDLDTIASFPRFKHADPEFVDGLIAEAARILEDLVAPTNHDGDMVGCEFDDGEVITPESFRAPWQAIVDGGWAALPFPTGHGGGDIPASVQMTFLEMLNSANYSFAMLPGLTQGGIDLLLEHADDEQKTKYMERLISGEWAATMCLTEPQAGTDLGLVNTKASPAGDGTYRISGTKIFISWGEHDLTDNIIHLVLARLPDAPPGTKGISLFIVPKFLVDNDGTIGERNDVICQSIEKKMGIKASPTCVMGFGEQTSGATGYLIGEPNQGMRQMFTMMNAARIGVGASGVGIPERSYQRAVAYAKERVQGRSLDGDARGSVTIIDHADVRRMLMLMSCQLQAMRALLFVSAAAADFAKEHPDEDVRHDANLRLELLTPVAKAWCTDVGQDVASLGIQVFGGMGFIEETGMAQYFRDMRIQSIYEGTNGVQALDLIGRKLPLEMGKPVLDLIAEMKALDADLAKASVATSGLPEPGATDTDVADALSRKMPMPPRSAIFQSIRAQLVDAVTAFEKATLWIFENGLQDPNDAAAGASNYLRMFGTVYGGHLLAKCALAAQRLLDEDGHDEVQLDYLRAKIVTARFYAEQVLPLGTALLGPVTAGKEMLYAIPEEAFGS